ncbi:unnamed protein product [Rotaria sp. Silwood1]|nr:unnamed protein product [Rotaria sp. Silwood1]
MKYTISILLLLLLTTTTILSDRFPHPDAINQITQHYKDSTFGNDGNMIKMYPLEKNLDDSILIENAYLVEFDQSANVRNFQKTIFNSLQRSLGISRPTITMRQVISSSLFTGASFSVNTDHSIEAIKSIPGAIAIYPIYFVPGPESFENYMPTGRKSNNQIDSIIAHKLTGVDQVHKELKNFGKGVRIAIIDSGIDYYHPALGGCFGPDCKVAFGYGKTRLRIFQGIQRKIMIELFVDLVGDRFSRSYIIPEPDNDPLDNCSKSSHGTHVAGILAANATEVLQTDYSPIEPFLGVAPQATIGSYRVFGCSGNGTTTGRDESISIGIIVFILCMHIVLDLITAAIYRAFEDKADIITMSIGSVGGYAEGSIGIAVQRVSEAGVYVISSMGNEGREGLQTGATPAIAKDVIAVASVDNSYEAKLYLIVPNGEKIFYKSGVAYGGWRSTVNSTIVVNDPQPTASDGCSGPSKPVSGAVVLYAFSTTDTCDSSVRCNKAAAEGAIGCLLYNISSIIGSSIIPSGSISLDDGWSIITMVTENPSAMFTFTNLLELIPTYLCYLFFIYCIGRTLALFLSQIGNPAPKTVGREFNNETRRPSISEVLSIFQSNANPVNIYNSTLLAPTVQQGAGLVNAFQAITATTVISPSELALNDTVRQQKSYVIEVSNIGKKTASYKISHRGAALITGIEDGNDQLLSQPLYSADYADVHIWPKYFQLHPGQSHTVTLQFRPPHQANPNFLPIYSGFIDVTNDLDEKVAHIPYAGVVGNYSDARIFVRNNPQGFISGIVDNDGYYIKDGQELNVTAAGAFPIILVTAWASRIIIVEVVSGENHNSPEFNSR